MSLRKKLVHLIESTKSAPKEKHLYILYVVYPTKLCINYMKILDASTQGVSEKLKFFKM